jgi:AcrR family transcriptional regulator
MNDAAALRVAPRRPRDSAKRDVATAKLRAQGLRTRKIIVRAATKLLLQSGGLDFTLRAVARQAKVSVSNLQYYFPDRLELLRAVMAPVVESYLSDLDRAMSSNAPPRQTLDTIVERWLEDAKNPNTMGLVWHFMTLANIDRECSSLVEEWYTALVGGTAQLIERANPEIGKSGSTKLATIVIAMGDGLGFQMRAGRGKSYTRDLEASYRAMVDFLLQRNPFPDKSEAKAAGKKG